MEKILFGTMPNGTPVEQYTLRAGQLEGTQEQFAKVAEQYKRTVDAIRALD